ncbi:MAG: V-type ATP synthase subunit F [Spirochaetaceae bacterium]|nr:V-type ATP synthase subunit F [Spirochaetaceae bacterium]GMO19144.1 MAG: hypothetical protein Pg6A_05860 [Termitinemataceae bacterium]
MDYYFLGENELVMAFRFVGVQGREVTGADDAASAFSEITCSQSCKILILSEKIADLLGDTLVEWQLSGKYPLIVEVPPLEGHIEGRKSLTDLIREAIGIHV